MSQLYRSVFCISFFWDNTVHTGIYTFGIEKRRPDRWCCRVVSASCLWLVAEGKTKWSGRTGRQATETSRGNFARTYNVRFPVEVRTVRLISQTFKQ